MAEELRTSRQWVHSCRVRHPKQNKDFVAVKEKLVTINKDNEIVKAEDNISFIEKPQRKSLDYYSQHSELTKIERK